MITAKSTKSFRKEDVQRDWFVVDASGKTVGRLATEVAALLRGKHKPWFTPHVDTGDFVIVTNASEVQMMGKRAEQKEYFRHSGFPGRGKTTTFKAQMADRPEKVIEDAVWGMLPKGRLGRQIVKKLKVYAGAEHPHEAQEPKEYELKG